MNSNSARRPNLHVVTLEKQRLHVREVGCSDFPGVDLRQRAADIDWRNCSCSRIPGSSDGMDGIFKNEKMMLQEFLKNYWVVKVKGKALAPIRRCEGRR